MPRTRNGFSRFIAASLSFFCLAAALLPIRSAADELQGLVVGVSDGDTLTLLVSGERLRVRLSDIDAPEHGQPYGSRARQSLAELCFRQSAMLATAGTDRYGRTLGTVTCGGIVANREQVRRGLAWVYVRYVRHGSALYAVEAEARMQHRGLWQTADPQPPWQWRRARRGLSAGARR